MWDSSGESDLSGDDGPAAGTGTHLAVTNMNRKFANVSFSKASNQGCCRSCKTFKSKFLCSTCRGNGLRYIFLCHAGRDKEKLLLFSFRKKTT